MAKLVLSRNGAVIHQCFVDVERLTIGREAQNQIVVDDPWVSRVHAAIVAIGNDHIIEDLRSANGTLVNGARIERRILQHSDVIELGGFHLRYLNAKVAADIDLEQTMLIANVPGRLSAPRDTNPGRDATVPASVAVRKHFPKGRVWIGAGPRAGEVIELDRVLTLFGKPGETAAVLRRPLGYYLAHVDGRRRPRVNGTRIGSEPRLLVHGDIIESGHERLEFTLEERDRR